MLTIPLFLTVSRLALSLTLLPYLLIIYLPVTTFYISSLLSFFIFILALTDFFDGYYARLLKQESSLGAQLDLLADKIFVGITLLIFVYHHKVWWFWVFILIAREIAVTLLRKQAQKKGFTVKVMSLGKLKSTIQYVYLMVVVARSYQCACLAMIINGIDFYVEQLLLSVSLLLSVISFLHYSYSYIKLSEHYSNK